MLLRGFDTFVLITERRPENLDVNYNLIKPALANNETFHDYYLKAEGPRQKLGEALCDAQQKRENSKCPVFNPKPFEGAELPPDDIIEDTDDSDLVTRPGTGRDRAKGNFYQIEQNCLNY